MEIGRGHDMEANTWTSRVWSVLGDDWRSHCVVTCKFWLHLQESSRDLPRALKSNIDWNPFSLKLTVCDVTMPPSGSSSQRPLVEDEAPPFDRAVCSSSTLTTRLLLLAGLGQLSDGSNSSDLRVNFVYFVTCRNDYRLSFASESWDVVYWLLNIHLGHEFLTFTTGLWLCSAYAWPLRATCLFMALWARKPDSL